MFAKPNAAFYPAFVAKSSKPAFSTQKVAGQALGSAPGPGSGSTCGARPRAPCSSPLPGPGRDTLLLAARRPGQGASGPALAPRRAGALGRQRGPARPCPGPADAPATAALCQAGPAPPHGLRAASGRPRAWASRPGCPWPGPWGSARPRDASWAPRQEGGADSAGAGVCSALKRGPEQLEPLFRRRKCKQVPAPVHPATGTAQPARATATGAGRCPGAVARGARGRFLITPALCGPRQPRRLGASSAPRSGSRSFLSLSIYLLRFRFQASDPRELRVSETAKSCQCRGTPGADERGGKIP